MRPTSNESEAELRARFDFSRADRGKYAERYRQGRSISILPGDSSVSDPLDLSEDDPQLVEIAGRHLLIAHLISAGFEVAEPIRDNGIDLVAYREREDGFVACPIQLKVSSHESFGLDKKYRGFPRLLIAYVWNVKTPERSEVYALTYDEALRILEQKGYAMSESWTREGQYFVRDAGSELKQMLEPFRMTRERWEEKLRAA